MKTWKSLGVLRTKIILASGKINYFIQQYSDVRSTSTEHKATVSIYLLLDFDPDVWVPSTVCFSVSSCIRKNWIRARFSGARVSKSCSIFHDIICLKGIKNLREEESRAKISSVWNDKELEFMSYSKKSPDLQWSFISLCFQRLCYLCLQLSKVQYNQSLVACGQVNYHSSPGTQHGWILQC